MTRRWWTPVCGCSGKEDTDSHNGPSSLWIRHKGADSRYRKTYLFGMSVRMLLGLYDGVVSLGVLAGGVAHDQNNVLSGIVSYPELMLLELPENSPLRKPITTIQDSGKRAVAIVQDLLTVARGIITHKEPLNLNDAVRRYLDSPEYRKLMHYHPTVTVTTNLSPDLLSIQGSPPHIGKIVMNLVSNAAEAIEGHGPGGHIRHEPASGSPAQGV